MKLNIIAWLVCLQSNVECVDEAAVRDKGAVKLTLETFSSCVSTFQIKSENIKIRRRPDMGAE